MTHARDLRQGWAITAVVVTLFLSGGCGDGNSISGSIDEAYPMLFDEVLLRKQAQALRIEYLRDIVGGIDKVLAIVVEDVTRAGVKKGVELVDQDFFTHVVIYRVASTGGDFPPVEEGSLRFKKFEFKAGGRVKAAMDVVFDNGRTLNADFDGLLQEVSVE